MDKKSIIERTLKAIEMLPIEKAGEISDFADFVLKRFEEGLLSEDIQTLNSQSASFDFLEDEEDLYKVSDLKEVYNVKR
jgi:hypothetical protein